MPVVNIDVSTYLRACDMHLLQNSVTHLDLSRTFALMRVIDPVVRYRETAGEQHRVLCVLYHMKYAQKYGCDTQIVYNKTHLT